MRLKRVFRTTLKSKISHSNMRLPKALHFLDDLTQKKSEIDEKLARILPEMDIADCNECGWDNKEIVCRFKVGSYHLYHHNCQIIRHTVLLICLTFCMLVGKLLKHYILNINYLSQWLRSRCCNNGKTII